MLFDTVEGNFISCPLCHFGIDKCSCPLEHMNNSWTFNSTVFTSSIQSHCDRTIKPHRYQGTVFLIEFLILQPPFLHCKHAQRAPSSTSACLPFLGSIFLYLLARWSIIMLLRSLSQRRMAKLLSDPGFHDLYLRIVAQSLGTSYPTAHTSVFSQPLHLMEPKSSPLD